MRINWIQKFEKERIDWVIVKKQNNDCCVLKKNIVLITVVYSEQQGVIIIEFLGKLMTVLEKILRKYQKLFIYVSIFPVCI